MTPEELLHMGQQRLARLREYDGILAFVAVISLGLCLAIVFGEPAGGVVFATLALWSFALRHQLRRFSRSLARDVAWLTESWDTPDTARADRVRDRCALGFWQMVRH